MYLGIHEETGEMLGWDQAQSVIETSPESKVVVVLQITTFFVRVQARSHRTIF